MTYYSSNYYIKSVFVIYKCYSVDRIVYLLQNCGDLEYLLSCAVTTLLPISVLLSEPSKCSCISEDNRRTFLTSMEKNPLARSRYVSPLTLQQPADGWCGVSNICYILVILFTYGVKISVTRIYQFNPVYHQLISINNQENRYNF